ncbi:MAG: MBL fold metallo-hydrolase [Solobacterium sp.]|nr:MBL fold metallo-hydrolase [Solobacterium sp.]
MHTAALLKSAAALSLLLGGCATYTGNAEKIREAQDVLKVTIFKVGKADAIILENLEHAVMIDAGEEDDAEKILKYLSDNGIERLDALIITHYDKDHVGAADSVAEAVPIQDVYLPAYESASAEYADFMKALDEQGLVPHFLEESVILQTGSLTLEIDPPDSYEIPHEAVDYDNNFSLITTVIHGKNRLVFTGDAMKQRLREWLSAQTEQCAFLKIPHHGVFDTELENLMKTLRPKFTAVCDSDKNPADADTVELIRKYGADVMETRFGKITVISDGRNIEMAQKKK